jgi:hypothetical protein
MIGKRVPSISQSGVRKRDIDITAGWAALRRCSEMSGYNGRAKVYSLAYWFPIT